MKMKFLLEQISENAFYIRINAKRRGYIFKGKSTWIGLITVHKANKLKKFHVAGNSLDNIHFVRKGIV